MKPLQNIKIGIVLPSVPGYSETFFSSKIAGLQKNGANVVLYVLNSDKIEGKFPCKIYQAPKLSGNKISVLLTSSFELLKAFTFNFTISRNFLALEKQDKTPLKKRFKHLIASHFILNYKLDWLHFGFGTMAIGRENVAKAIDAKIAVSFRGFDASIYPLKHPNCYISLFKKVDKIHIISDDILRLLENQGMKRLIVKKITPAIDTDFFINLKNRNTESLNFLTVGRLHWKKGLEYTLEALSILKTNNINFQYTIIGDGPERERLIFAAYQLGLEKNVTFAGKLSPDEIKEQLSKATIYIQYSIQEGFCNAVLEAQAMGLLCIVSDAEGLSENVLHNKTGWVVPKRNSNLLAKKINEILILEDEIKNEISRNAADRVRTQFNIDKQTQEFVDFYKL